MPKVTMVGLRSSALNTEKWPELTVDKLEAAFKRVEEDMHAAGYQATWCLLAPDDTAIEQTIKTLLAERPDVVLIGAGIRVDTDYFPLFEKLINVIHSYAPQAYIAFNTNPLDSVEAVKRWA